ncbi:MAG: hypothetical protein L7S55_06055 [Luminiphilus sp.]|nr:hypothetical protein [Luminiphilus sp.]
MAKKDKQDEKQEEMQMFDVMPGADPMEPDPETPVDLSFGLSDESETENTVMTVDDLDESVEEPVESSEQDIDVTEETVAEDLALGDTQDETAEEAEDASSRIVEEEDPPDDDETVAVEDPLPNSDDETPPEQVKKSKPNHMVPKKRLDEVLGKLKASQKELEEMKKATTPPPDAPEAYDFDAKEAEYMNLVLDGREKEAVALRQQIRAAEKTQLEWEMGQKMQQTVSNNQTATALQRAASEIESSFPIFDKNSDQYDEGMTQEVIELRDAFIIKGDDPVEALSRAAAFVIKSNDMLSNEEGSTLGGSAAPKVDEVSKKRAEVTKKLNQAKAQPPELPGESSSSRGEKPINLATMSEEEFNALPDATLKRLRGDLY